MKAYTNIVSDSPKVKKKESYKIPKQQQQQQQTDSKNAPAAVSYSLPQILVAMNLAFAMSGNSNTIQKDDDDAGAKEGNIDNPDDDVATDDSVKHCHTNRNNEDDVNTVPTIITTPNSTPARRSKSSIGEVTFDSFGSASSSIGGVDAAAVNHNNTNMQPSKRPVVDVKGKIHDLRTDLQTVTPKGVAGNLLFWWVYPVKWVSDPVLGVAESIVPVVTSKVPFSDTFVGMGLDATSSVAHFAYGITEHMGIMTASPDFEEVRARIMTQLLSLADQSMAVKDEFIKALYAEAGKREFLLGMDKDLFFSLTLEQDVDIETWTKGFGGLYDYMKEAHVHDEIEKMGGMLRYFENKAVLGVLQQSDLNMLGKRRYDDMLFTEEVSTTQKEVKATFPLHDASRYAKFAVAAYGNKGILSANLDVNQAVDLRRGDMTKIRISEHTGIPCEDIEVMGVDYGEEPNHLSHFVAVDHENKKIVLGIRGTHEKRFLNFDGQTKEFLGGQAHKGIATMTENLWKGVGYSVIRLLHENPWYELIVTGHSLGGGVTVLLNMLLHKDERIRGHNFRCFAYGSPPVFCPVTSVPAHIAKTCVVIVNQYDKVPFTSGDSVRRQTALIDVVEHMDLDLMQRARLVLGLDTPNAELVKQLHTLQAAPWRVLPDAKPGIPRGLGYPSAAAMWIIPNDKRDGDADQYTYVLSDPQKMTHAGMFVHKNEFNDHLPARYEHVLSHMVKQ